MKCSPYPWKLSGTTSIRDADNRPIAIVRSLEPKMDGSHNESAANAYLIIAAPFMHEAIKTHCNFCDEGECDECIFAEALEKARGES